MSEIENTETVQAAAAAEAVEPVETVVVATEAVETTETVETVEAGVETTETVEPAVAEATVAEPEAKAKKRIRGSSLFAAAVVLGVVGGVGTGYAIQYFRPATPLPPLAQSQPAYAPPAVYQGIAPTILPASQDDATLTDGDLTKLLLSKPAGASDAEFGWLDQSIDIEQDADLCDKSAADCFTDDYQDGVDAIADTSWVQNGYYVEIRVFRFSPGQSRSAQNWAGDGNDESNQITMPAGINASGYEFRDSNGDNDDTAWAVHGDLAVKFWVTSPSKVPNPSIIDKVITEQMGRL